MEAKSIDARISRRATKRKSSFELIAKGVSARDIFHRCYHDDDDDVVRCTRVRKPFKLSRISRRATNVISSFEPIASEVSARTDANMTTTTMSGSATATGPSKRLVATALLVVTSMIIIPTIPLRGQYCGNR